MKEFIQRTKDFIASNPKYKELMEWWKDERMYFGETLLGIIRKDIEGQEIFKIGTIGVTGQGLKTLLQWQLILNALFGLFIAYAIVIK